MRIDWLTETTVYPVCLATRSAVRCRVPDSLVSIEGSGTSWVAARRMREASRSSTMPPSILASSRCRVPRRRGWRAAPHPREDPLVKPLWCRWRRSGASLTVHGLQCCAHRGSDLVALDHLHTLGRRSRAENARGDVGGAEPQPPRLSEATRYAGHRPDLAREAQLAEGDGVVG